MPGVVRPLKCRCSATARRVHAWAKARFVERMCPHRLPYFSLWRRMHHGGGAYRPVAPAGGQGDGAAHGVDLGRISPSVLITASDWAAKASLSSYQPMSELCRPA